MTRAFISWLILGLGVGSITAIIRYIVVWYAMRRFRRMLRRTYRREPT